MSAAPQRRPTRGPEPRTTPPVDSVPFFIETKRGSQARPDPPLVLEPLVVDHAEAATVIVGLSPQSILIGAIWVGAQLVTTSSDAGAALIAGDTQGGRHRSQSAASGRSNSRGAPLGRLEGADAPLRRGSPRDTQGNSHAPPGSCRAGTPHVRLTLATALLPGGSVAAWRGRIR